MSTNQNEYYRGLEAASHALRDHVLSPAAQAATVYHALQPLLNDTEHLGQLACRIGCSHCCKYPVGITYPEAARLAEALQSRPELAERVRSDHAELSELPWESLVGHACPLLIDDACSLHQDRPMPCRALGSLNEQACADALVTDHPPPRDEQAWWRGLGAASKLATLKLHGSRELRSAVSAILSAGSHDPERAFLEARAAPGSDIT